MKMHPVRVARKWLEAEGIMAFELVSPEGTPLPAFTPGAHVTIRVTPVGQPPLLRTYSLCNAPGERDRYVLGIKREPASRGGSVAMHDAVKIGDLLDISAPQNHFPLCASASSHLLLGAGIGITPLLAMAQHLHIHGQAFDLHYFMRGAEHVAFRNRLAPGETAGSVHYHAGLTAPQVSACLKVLMASPPADCHAYACGPAAFMQAVRAIGDAEWGSQRLHFEHFQAPESSTSGSNSEFEVRLARSGRSCRVGPEETIVAALARIGCSIDVSCEQGVCGTCLTRVLAGEPEHRDAYLTDAEHMENEQMLVCVSRARSPVLELDL